MNEKYEYNQDAVTIIQKLFEEFDKEENALKVQFDNNSSKIDELEENILNFMKNDDIDYKVFSPRSIVSTNKEKADQLKKEKEELEKKNKEIFKQMEYYTDKTEKLSQLIKLVGKDESVDSEEDVQQGSSVNVVKTESNTETNIETDSLENENEVQIEKGLDVDSIVTVSLLEHLKRINHKLELCSKFIDHDAVRAKIEINSIVKNLDDVIISLKI